MQQKFSRKELERLGCEETEIDLVMNYQKKIPLLSLNNSEKFSIDARLLHKQLNVKKKFATWIKSNLNDYKEGEDFITSSPQGTGNNKGRFSNETEYILTLDLAKEIAMYTGRSSKASKELKETSRMVRKYFILMERIVYDNKEWLAIRDPEKEEYKRMCEEVNSWCIRLWHRKAYRSDYAVEADMLNVIISGKTSQQLKSEYHVSSYDLIRDYLKREHNEELLFLEKQNQVLLRMDMGFSERKSMLQKMYESTFEKENNANVA